MIFSMGIRICDTEYDNYCTCTYYRYLIGIHCTYVGDSIGRVCMVFNLYVLLLVLKARHLGSSAFRSG